MHLYDRTSEQLFGSMAELRAEDLATQREVSNNTRLHYAFTAASSVSDFRESYGYKATPCFIFQQATVALSIVLRDMQANPHLRTEHRRSGASGILPSDTAIQDSETAFEECFRCLLGTGV